MMAQNLGAIYDFDSRYVVDPRPFKVEITIWT